MFGSGAIAWVKNRFAKPKAEPAPRIAGESAKAESTLDIGFGQENPNPLISRKGIEIIDEMRLDDALGAFMDMKKAARLCTDWRIEPASDEPEDQEIAEFVRDVLLRIPGSIKERIWDILSAMDYGYSITNKPLCVIDSGPFAGKIGYQDFKTKEPHNFTFKMDEFRNVEGLVHRTADMDEKTYPVDDFIVYSYRKEFSNPYGSSDFTRCYWAWNSKKHVRRMWDAYLERHGGGLIDIEFEAGKSTDDDHEVAKKLVKDIQMRTGYLHPNTYKLTVHETTGRGADVFKDAIGDRNIYMARAVLLPDLLGFSGKPSGSYALGKKHFDVFLWVLEDIGRDIQETIMLEQIIKPIVDLNYANVEQYPRFEFEPLSSEDKFNILTNLIAAVEKGVVTSDIDIENFVRKLLGLVEKEEEDPPPEETPPPPEPEEPEDEPPELDEDLGLEPHTLFAFTRPKLSRKPNKYEQKINFAQIIDTTDTLESYFVKTWAELFETSQKKLVEDVKKRRIVKDGLYAEVDKLTLSRRSDMRKALERFSLMSYYYGALEAQQEVKRGITKTHMMPDKFAIDPVELTLDEIEQYFADKKLVVSPAIKKMSASVKKRAFFVTGLHTDAILSQSKMVILNGIQRGDEMWTQGQLKKLFDGFIKQGVVTDRKLGEAWRIEIIARNNFNTAFNEGRKRKLEDPDVADFVVAYGYSAILDDATTDYCRDMDGKTFAKEDMNREGWPPSHHGCRSVVFPITRGEEFEFNDMPRGVKRGDGFSLNAVEYCEAVN